MSISDICLDLHHEMEVAQNDIVRMRDAVSRFRDKLLTYYAGDLRPRQNAALLEAITHTLTEDAGVSDWNYLADLVNAICRQRVCAGMRLPFNIVPAGGWANARLVERPPEGGSR